jgi:hypothetical protein
MHKPSQIHIIYRFWFEAQFADFFVILKPKIFIINNINRYYWFEEGGQSTNYHKGHGHSEGSKCFTFFNSKETKEIKIKKEEKNKKRFSRYFDRTSILRLFFEVKPSYFQNVLHGNKKKKISTFLTDTIFHDLLEALTRTPEKE